MNISLKNIYKSFEDNMVLRGVSLSIEDGEVIAIAGENGAGKSTLMKILSGALLMDSGEILIDGKSVNFRNPQDAMNYGIRMIYQEMNLIPDLSVAENMFLVDENHKYGHLFVDKKMMLSDAKQFLEKLGIDIDPNTKVSKLSVAEQQLVEISKSLVKEAKLIIMDEPTAALNKEEVNRLFEQIHKLKENGVTVIYITHHLEEIFELADRVAILRDGKVVLLSPTKDVDQSQLVLAMVGKQIDNFYPKERNTNREIISLEVLGLTCKPYFKNISFKVHKGEVLGIGGLMGSGKSELLHCLFGDIPLSSGKIIVGGKTIDIHKPNDAIANGIGFLTADRKQEGLIMDMSILQNLSIVSLKNFVKTLGYVDLKKEANETKKFMKQVNIKTSNFDMTVRHLSGGNQQKVVFGKWMMTKPKVFMMEEPTRGVDVGAKTEIYGLINQLTREGISIILVTSDIPELVAMSDRVIIFKNGEIVKELVGDLINQHNILNYSMRGEIVDKH
ncbi:MAG: sugar ABC transporter ATP-binding protein [Thermoanaerobacterium sp.]|nr:sugar ABC transporter ATP-binding protein [Thermoanaerobacterium sp.]